MSAEATGSGDRALARPRAERLWLAANHGAIGGGEVMLLQTARTLRELGVPVSIVAPAEPTDLVDAARAAGFATTALPARGRAEWMRALRRWDATARRGVLWCHGLVPAAATAGHRDRIVHLHQEPRGRAQRALATAARLGALAVLVPSEWMAARLPGTRPLVNWTAEFPAAAPRERAADAPLVVGFLGRPSPDKGVDVLAAAVAQLDAAEPGRWRLLLAGEPRFVDDADRARVEAALAPIAHLVDRPGWIDPADYFARVDVATVPSVWGEPFGLVAAESLAAGVPLVVADNGALPEIVGDAGRIVPPGDAAALAEAIAAAAAQRGGEREAVRTVARARWQERFSPAAGRERVAALLAELGIGPRADRAPVVAIAHDYLTQRGGAERVVLAMSRAFPDARIHTTLHDPEGTFPEFAERDIVVSPLNRIGALRRDHRRALPLLAFASGRMRIDADVVVASSSGWAHGFRTRGRTLVYCHTPARWLYLPDDYLGDSPSAAKRLALGVLAPPLRRWDRRAARRADRYLANSTVVRERIARVYHRDSAVRFPPHGIDASGALAPIAAAAEWVDEERGFFLLVSRLLPYKHVQHAIAAFAELPDERLLVVGDGPLRAELERAAGTNARIVSGISDAELRWAYAESHGLIAPSHEDFGLTVLEAAAWGKPVAALRAGGYLDTVVEGVTGVHFDAPDAASIRDAVLELRAREFDADRIRAHAEMFSEARFSEMLRREVAELLGRPGDEEAR